MNPLIAASPNISYQIGHITFLVLVGIFVIWLGVTILKKFL